MRNTDTECVEFGAGPGLGVHLSPEKNLDSEQFKMGPAGVTALRDRFFKGRQSERFCEAGLKTQLFMHRLGWTGCPLKVPRGH